MEGFLTELGPKQAQKVAWVLRMVKELPIVPKQYLKKLQGTEEIWEVRAEFGSNAFRLLGFWDEGQLIILTNAFAKKSQKRLVARSHSQNSVEATTWTERKNHERRFGKVH